MTTDTFAIKDIITRRQRVDKDAALYAAMIDAIVYAVECMYEAKAWRLWLEGENKQAFMRCAPKSWQSVHDDVKDATLDNYGVESGGYWQYMPAAKVLSDYTYRVQESFIDMLDQVHTVLASLGHEATMASKIISYQRMHNMLEAEGSIHESKRLGLAWLQAAYKFKKLDRAGFVRDQQSLDAFYNALLTQYKPKSVHALSQQTYGLSQFGLFKKPDVFALHVEDFYNKAHLKRLRLAKPGHPFGFYGLQPRLRDLVLPHETASAHSVLLDYDPQTATSVLPFSYRYAPFIGVMDKRGCLHSYRLTSSAVDRAKLDALALKQGDKLVVHCDQDWSRLLALKAAISENGIAEDNIVVVRDNQLIALREQAKLREFIPELGTWTSCDGDIESQPRC